MYVLVAVTNRPAILQQSRQTSRKNILNNLRAKQTIRARMIDTEMTAAGRNGNTIEIAHVRIVDACLCELALGQQQAQKSRARCFEAKMLT